MAFYNILYTALYPFQTLVCDSYIYIPPLNKKKVKKFVYNLREGVKNMIFVQIPYYGSLLFTKISFLDHALWQIIADKCSLRPMTFANIGE